MDQDCDGGDLLDADGDGHDAVEAGGDDCDDDDPDYVSTEYGLDLDGDGFGDPENPQFGCDTPDPITDANGNVIAEYVPNTGDCDDRDHNSNPNALEICTDGVDNDCDGKVDEEEACALDTDEDGVPDEDEIKDGTDPYNSDTDGDGAMDGQEKKWGTNAINGPDTTVYSVAEDGEFYTEDGDLIPYDGLTNVAPDATATSLVEEDPDYSVALGYTADKVNDGDDTTFASPADCEFDYELAFDDPFSDLTAVRLVWGDYGENDGDDSIQNWELSATTADGVSVVILAESMESPNGSESLVVLDEPLQAVEWDTIKVEGGCYSEEYGTTGWIGIYELEAWVQ